MNCELFMRRYLEMDNGASMPLSLRAHLAACAKCRLETARMERMTAELIARMDELGAPDRSARIMEAVRSGGEPYGRRVPLYNWVSGEVIIIASIVLARFSDPLVWMNGYFGTDLELPFNAVLGILLTVYSAFFIGTHMREIKDFIDKYRLRQP